MSLYSSTSLISLQTHYKTKISAMSLSKNLLIIAALFAFFLFLVEANDQEMKTETDGMTTSYGPKMDCGGACQTRCRLSSRPNLCKRACGTCCARCNCVPPGTSGNHHLCPCYAALTTHGGRRKCP